MAVAQDIVQRLLQLLPGVRQGDADGRAAVHRLHHAGHRQLLHKGGYVIGGVGDLTPLGGQDAGALHDALGHGLVHGHGAAQRAGAGIGHAQQLQRGLNFAVLAVDAVEAQEHAVSQSTDVQHAHAQMAGAFQPAGGFHGLQIRRCLGNADAAAEAVRRVEGVLQTAGVVLQPQKHIHKNGLVARVTQGAAHRGGSDQRDAALRADAAAQYYDLHAVTSFLLFSAFPKFLKSPSACHQLAISAASAGDRPAGRAWTRRTAARREWCPPRR